MTATPAPILVTGAGGFTGLALTRALTARGHSVRALARKPGQVPELERTGAEVLQGDIRDPEIIRRSVDGRAVVFHLAAVFRRAGVPDSLYREVHVDATRDLIEAASSAGVRRFVHCSTVGVHGDISGDGPADENAPMAPGDIYQRTKLEGEAAARETAARVGLPLTVVRPGPIYGPEDRRLLKLIGGVARRRFLLLGSGKPHFQMVYVDDLVEGLRLAAERPEAVGRTYILTGEEAPTLRELVQEIAAIARVPAPRVRLPVWPFWVAGALCEAVCVPFGLEPPIYRRRVKFFTNNRWFDTSRARAELGFMPRMPLREGLRRTLDSYRTLGWV
ncbi:MAG TPA: NAD-dependent epimerase/dehydratase family protein [Gemmatimonadales bacterium]|nr:NAD-dependent epimerase/dehydratase family protein [Gemmatimonadales bacterium]